MYWMSIEIYGILITGGRSITCCLSVILGFDSCFVLVEASVVKYCTLLVEAVLVAWKVVQLL